jgi:hypothetical protein
MLPIAKSNDGELGVSSATSEISHHAARRHSYRSNQSLSHFCRLMLSFKPLAYELKRRSATLFTCVTNEAALAMLARPASISPCSVLSPLIEESDFNL